MVAKESAVGALCGLVLGAFVLVVGVCCRVVTFHVSYRLEHGYGHLPYPPGSDHYLPYLP